jgi:regulator of replication initiation timing
VKIPALLLSFALCFSTGPLLHAQDPGARQDAEAAREKLLKAADQLDNIQANSEATKTAVDGMKADVAKLQGDVTQLQTENATLRQQLADMQTSFDQFKQEQIKARQTLIDNVAALIAASKGSSAPVKKKKDASAPDATTGTSGQAKTPDAQTVNPNLAPPPDPTSGSTGSTAPSATAATATESAPAPVKPQKGYYHVVAAGETLTLICNAYKENGVNITVADIRKANGLTEKSSLKVGQKLFIPKPDSNL